jgi:hypothetical protein
MTVSNSIGFLGSDSERHNRRGSAHSRVIADLSADWKRWSVAERVTAMTILVSVLATSSLAAIGGV